MRGFNPPCIAIQGSREILDQIPRSSGRQPSKVRREQPTRLLLAGRIIATIVDQSAETGGTARLKERFRKSPTETTFSRRRRGLATIRLLPKRVHEHAIQETTRFERDDGIGQTVLRHRPTGVDAEQVSPGFPFPTVAVIVMLLDNSQKLCTKPPIQVSLVSCLGTPRPFSHNRLNRDFARIPVFRSL